MARHALVDLPHNVEHLPRYFLASLVVCGGFVWGIIAKPGIGIVNSMTRNSALDDGAGLVGHTARHQSDEIVLRIGVRIVELGIGADCASHIPFNRIHEAYLVFCFSVS